MPSITFAGLASGLDTTSLIQSILSTKRKQRISPLDSKISASTDTNETLTKLKELLGNLKSAADPLRTLNGSPLSKLATSSAENTLSASASSAATNGNYTVSVSSLAKNGTLSFDDRFSSTNSALASGINDASSAASRTVSISVGTGASTETTSIVLTSGTTLEDIASQFNSASNKATASIVNVGSTSSPSYALVFNSSNQGTELGSVSASVGSEITANSRFASQTVNQASDSQFTVSGITGTLTRSTNSISDVISGVTFDLRSTGTATVAVSDDSAATTATLENFVEAYNDIVKFIKEQDAVTQSSERDGSSSNVFSPLAATAIDENILSSIRGAFSSASVSGRLINTLADLGITSNRDGTLSLDEDDLASAISEDSEGVRQITQRLGDTLSNTDGTIAQYTRFGGIIDSAVKNNTSLISQYNSQIAVIEKTLASEEQALNGRFSRLESLIGRLNGQQAALSGLF